MAYNLSMINLISVKVRVHFVRDRTLKLEHITAVGHQLMYHSITKAETLTIKGAGFN